MTQQETNNTTVQGSLFRAAEYVRMSTEHQQYSTQNQADRIREYAARRGIQIVRTYADEGKSGLKIGGRIRIGIGGRCADSGGVPHVCDD